MIQHVLNTHVRYCAKQQQYNGIGHRLSPKVYRGRYPYKQAIATQCNSCYKEKTEEAVTNSVGCLGVFQGIWYLSWSWKIVYWIMQMKEGMRGWVEVEMDAQLLKGKAYLGSSPGLCITRALPLILGHTDCPACAAVCQNCGNPQGEHVRVSCPGLLWVYSILCPF